MVEIKFIGFIGQEIFLLPGITQDRLFGLPELQEDLLPDELRNEEPFRMLTDDIIGVKWFLLLKTHMGFPKMLLNWTCMQLIQCSVSIM